MTKQEADIIKLEYLHWLDAMAMRFGSTPNEVAKLIREYERKFEKLQSDSI